MSKSKLTPREIEILVLRAKNGDSDAFARLYDEFADQIYRYIYFKVSRNDAVDLTENVFLKVWENLKKYKSGRQYFSSWIFKIAHNVVVDHYRLSKTFTSLEYDVPDERKEVNPAYLMEQKISSDVLRKAISRLKGKYQQILVLKYINELENREIARIMRRSEGSLRILKFRALKALRRILEDMNISY
jgi:RNA polymerase sigma-70 factor (ECF subfamily)